MSYSQQCISFTKTFDDEEFNFEQQVEEQGIFESDEVRYSDSGSEEEVSCENTKYNHDTPSHHDTRHENCQSSSEDECESEDESDFTEYNSEHVLCRPHPQDSCQKQPLRMTYVNMPTGKRFSIVVPIQKHHKCDGKPKLITLKADGKLGEREYTIVKKEMENTMHTHRKSLKGYEIIKIQKVLNCNLWRQFRERERQVVREQDYVNEQMIFHGSPRVDKIVKEGFDKHNIRGGNLGEGFYLSKKSSVANQSVFGRDTCKRHNHMNCSHCVRKMILARVCLGKVYEVTTPHSHWSYPPQNYHSIEAVPCKPGLKYPEHAVYSGDQAYPEFVITYKIRN